MAEPLPPPAAQRQQTPAGAVLEDMMACVAALLPCLPARELQAVALSPQSSHQRGRPRRSFLREPRSCFHGGCQEAPVLLHQPAARGPTDDRRNASEAQLTVFTGLPLHNFSLLENEMRRVERVNVGLMSAGMGISVDVFPNGKCSSAHWEKRQAKVLENVKTRMMNQKNSDTSSTWSDIWVSPTRYQSSEEEATESVKRAATAARRWQEYSRKGADRPPRYRGRSYWL